MIPGLSTLGLSESAVRRACPAPAPGCSRRPGPPRDAPRELRRLGRRPRPSHAHTDRPLGRGRHRTGARCRSRRTGGSSRPALPSASSAPRAAACWSRRPRNSSCRSTPSASAKASRICARSTRAPSPGPLPDCRPNERDQGAARFHAPGGRFRTAGGVLRDLQVERRRQPSSHVDRDRRLHGRRGHAAGHHQMSGGAAPGAVTVLPVPGLPEFRPADDLAGAPGAEPRTRPE